MFSTSETVPTLCQNTARAGFTNMGPCWIQMLKFELGKYRPRPQRSVAAFRARFRSVQTCLCHFPLFRDALLWVSL